MDSENKIIDKALYKLYEQGKNEVEAFEEISKSHNSYSISLKAVSNWFAKISSGEYSVDDNKKPIRKSKFTDDYIISLVNDNPELNLAELAKLANTTACTISKRLNEINADGERVSYRKKHSQDQRRNFDDEYIINLINENPELSMHELAKLTGTSRQTITRRLGQINSDEKRVFYIKKSAKNGPTKFTDEYLINLIKENPGLNMTDLANIGDISQATISKRLKKINSSRSCEDKIVLERNMKKPQRKIQLKITDESIINLVNENPEMKMSQIATLANVSTDCISKRLSKINADTERVNYRKKTSTNGPHKKFTDEYLIKLINDNPGMNMTELAALLNCCVASISNRLGKINSEGEMVNYHKKTKLQDAHRKFTDEFLINLINENPELNTYELAKLADTSQTTILRRIKNINKDGEKVRYINKKSKK
jgi:DeoR/GlpR family transcriptional regulator of sugar metabolism